MLNMSAVWDMKMFNKINGCCYYYCKLSIIKSTVMLKLQLQYFGHLMQSRLIGKNSDAGKD